jgi:hypothetical protein
MPAFRDPSDRKQLKAAAINRKTIFNLVEKLGKNDPFIKQNFSDISEFILKF